MENEKNTRNESIEETAEAGTEENAVPVIDLKKDKLYRKGQLIYDFSMGVFLLLLLFNSALTLMSLEIYSGGVFYTSYLHFAYILPCVFMLAGLGISVSAAKKLNKEEKKDKIWFIVLSVISVLILALCIMDTIHPSYHVYSVEETKADDGTVFTVAKSETVHVNEEVHTVMPTYYDIDVYTVNGIFAKRLIKVPTHKGPYAIKHRSGNDYRLTVSYLGIQEGFPFSL